MTADYTVASLGPDTTYGKADVAANQIGEGLRTAPSCPAGYISLLLC